MKCSFCGLDKNELTRYNQEQEICNDCLKNGLFLVRTSDGVVLGPYKLEDLTKIIEDKIIVLLDEVSLNGSDWSFVKDVELFKQALANSSYELDEATSSIQTSVIEKGELPPSFTNDNISQDVVSNVSKTESPFDNSFLDERPAKEKPKRNIWKLLTTSTIIILLGYIAIITFNNTNNRKSTEGSVAETTGSFSLNDYVLRAKDLFTSGLYKSADRFYLKALALSPELTEAKIYHAGIMVFTGEDLKTAKETLSKLATQINMGRIVDVNLKTDISLFLGLLAYKENRLEEAESYFKQSISFNPSSKDAFFNLGILSLKNNNYDKAIEYFDSLLTLDANDICTNVYKALVLNKLGKYPESLDILRSLLVKFPYSSMIYLYAAYSLFKTDKILEAKKMLNKIANLEPFFMSKLTKHIRRIDTQEFLENKESEYLSVLSSADDFKDFVGFYTAKAFVLVEHKELKDAKRLITKALRKFHESAQLYALLGMLYYQESNYQASITYINKALMLDYSNSLAHLYAALIYLQSKDTLTQALNHSIKAYTSNSLFLTALMLQGDVYYKFNQETEAFMIWKKLLSIEPNYYLVQYRLKLSHLIYKNN